MISERVTTVDILFVVWYKSGKIDDFVFMDDWTVGRPSTCVYGGNGFCFHKNSIIELVPSVTKRYLPH